MFCFFLFLIQGFVFCQNNFKKNTHTHTQCIFHHFKKYISVQIKFNKQSYIVCIKCNNVLNIVVVIENKCFQQILYFYKRRPLKRRSYMIPYILYKLYYLWFVKSVKTINWITVLIHIYKQTYSLMYIIFITYVQDI